jgi:hypothetical protein
LVLFGVFDCSGFADYCDADLARKTQLGFDPLGDVPGHQLGSRVIDLLWLDQDPDLASGLDGVGLLDALERVCDLLQLLQSLDVSLQ